MCRKVAPTENRREAGLAQQQTKVFNWISNNTREKYRWGNCSLSISVKGRESYMNGSNSRRWRTKAMKSLWMRYVWKWHLWKEKNRRGPKTLPWMTPLVMGAGSESVWSLYTICNLEAMHIWSQGYKFPRIPWTKSFDRRRLREIYRRLSQNQHIER